MYHHRPGDHDDKHTIMDHSVYADHIRRTITLAFAGIDHYVMSMQETEQLIDDLRTMLFLSQKAQGKR